MAPMAPPLTCSSSARRGAWSTLDERRLGGRVGREQTGYTFFRGRWRPETRRTLPSSSCAVDGGALVGGGPDGQVRPSTAKQLLPGRRRAAVRGPGRLCLNVSAQAACVDAPLSTAQRLCGRRRGAAVRSLPAAALVSTCRVLCPTCRRRRPGWTRRARTARAVWPDTPDGDGPGHLTLNVSSKPAHAI